VTTARPSSPPADVAPNERRVAVPPPQPRLRQAAATTATYAACVGGALVLCALLVAATGGSWSKVFTSLVDGSFRSPGAWGLTLTTAAPLLVVAVGTIVATRAGLVNIGQEGQLIIGAACTAYAAVRLPGPGGVVLATALLAGAAGGALWAGIAAGMRYWRGVPEVISTLLLVFVAFQLVAYGLTKEWLLLDRADRVNRLNTGEPLPPDVHLPAIRVFGNTISTSVLIAVALAVVVSVFLARTVLGFRLRMLGLNPRTARRAGVSATLVGGGALVASGAFAGGAGGLLLTGGVAGDRLTLRFSGNVGWQGLLVALLARDKPLVAVPMAVVFAALRTGSGFLASTGVERRIADVVQAMLVLALLVPPALLAVRDRRRSIAASRAAS
jgi:simple sugar transport system permease protein